MMCPEPKGERPVCHPEVAEQELIVLRGEVAHLKVCLDRSERKLPLTDLEAQVEAYKARLDRALCEVGDLREELSEARERIEELATELHNAEQSVKVATMTVKNNTIDFHRQLAKLTLERERLELALHAELYDEDYRDELELARCKRDLWRDAYEAPPWEAKDPEAIKLVEVDVYVTGEVSS